MSRPHSTHTRSFSYLNADGLTPRSARSFHDIPLSNEPRNDQSDFHPEPQSLPLLPPPDDDKPKEFSPPSKSAVTNVVELLSRIPLMLGILVSLLLFILVVIAYEKPQALLEAAGETDAPLLAELLSSSSAVSSLIDYSDYDIFPLQPLEYAAECWKVIQAHSKHYGYWTAPPMGIMDVQHEDNANSVHHRCRSTITYQLDSSVGLTAHLAFIAQLAAMANERNRTFFIDDSLWNRGRWTDHFEDIKDTQPGPEPGCAPPPPDELVACPRLARHWIVNSRTAKFHFGHDFEDHYHDAYAKSLNRSRPVFEQGAKSLANVIIPSRVNARYIDLARSEMNGRRYLGVHIRRGTFITSMRVTASQSMPRLNAAWIASDSAAALEELFAQAADINYFSLSQSSHPELQVCAPASEYNQSTWNDLPIEQRVLETRGMIVDLAMLSGAWNIDSSGSVVPEASICGLSSTVCRLTAMFLGWKRAFEENRWVEIDNAGTIEPIWSPYELF